MSNVCHTHLGNTSLGSTSQVELWPLHPHYIGLVLHTQLKTRETKDRHDGITGRMLHGWKRHHNHCHSAGFLLDSSWKRHHNQCHSLLDSSLKIKLSQGKVCITYKPPVRRIKRLKVSFSNGGQMWTLLSAGLDLCFSCSQKEAKEECQKNLWGVLRHFCGMEGKLKLWDVHISSGVSPQLEFQTSLLLLLCPKDIRHGVAVSDNVWRSPLPPSFWIAIHSPLLLLSTESLPSRRLTTASGCRELIHVWDFVMVPSCTCSSAFEICETICAWVN